MNRALLPLLRCPVCEGHPLNASAQGLQCPRCGAAFGSEEGFTDLLPAPEREVITPFQRVMQTPLVVAVYEKWWRRVGYRLASSRSFDAELSTILRYSELLRGSPVLDAACGTGVFTRPLARRTEGLVVGFDLSRPMLRHAVRRARGERLANIDFVRGTVFRLPFGTGTFQQVNCCGALHLFDEPIPALSELVRVLAPGGCLTVQTTIRPERSGGFAWLLERWIRFGFFAEDELLQLLARHPLEVRDTERHRISLSLVAFRKI
jgi:ubiquinone/menaquinone biosynthesis C-methylase UbiE